MPFLERWIGSLVTWNNRRITDDDAHPDNPYPLDDTAWAQDVARAHPTIRAEWQRFADHGGRLPLIEDLILESQGNEGPWRLGLLVSNGRPVGPLCKEFPQTMAAVRAIPGLRSAMWSELAPGTELPEHEGPNKGVLRYHLGVVCNPDTALRVGETVVPYRNGTGVLFDDTHPHAAWNRGPSSRITLFCEILRPLTGTRRLANGAVQRLLSFDSRYRRAAERAWEWHHTLNPR